MAKKKVKRSGSKSALEQPVPHVVAYAVLIMLFILAIMYVKKVTGTY